MVSLKKLVVQKKKNIPWVNGKFGFGVHSGRAFAKKIKFYSQIIPGKGATIEIDRDVDEHTPISCETTDFLDKLGMEHGTVVEISNFDPKVFNKKAIYAKLSEEIKKHFDDILRRGNIKITITEKVDGKEIPIPINPFDYDSLEGVVLKKDITIGTDGKGINVKLKVVEKPQKDRVVTIQNNGRRVSDLVEMRSFIQFYKNNNKNINLWRHPYLVGYIETNGICSPNITRDDFEPGENQDEIYSKLMELEPEIKTLIENKLKNKNQEAYNKLGSFMSSYLNDYLRKFRFEFYKPDKKVDIKEKGEKPTINIAEETAKLQNLEKNVGSTVEAEPLVISSQHEPIQPPTSPPIKPTPPIEPDDILAEDMNGIDAIGKGEGKNDLPLIKSKGKETVASKKSYGPLIKFRDTGPDQDRVTDLIDTLEINTSHPDFIKRSEQKDGKIVLSPRLINYVAIIIAPPIIHKIYVKEGQMPNPKEVGERNTIFITGFEDYLINNANEMVLEVENA